MTPTVTAPSSPPSSIDPKLVVPLVNSIRALFSTMVKLDVAIERPHIKTAPAPSYDVSGIIGLSGDLVGSIVVSFQMEAAVKVVSIFTGTTLDADSPDFPDAVGELANMIAGGAKKAFDGKANITVPNVVIGAHHRLPRLSDVPCLVIPCRTRVGEFAVEISLKKVGPANRPTIEGGAA